MHSSTSFVHQSYASIFPRRCKCIATSPRHKACSQFTKPPLPSRCMRFTMQSTSSTAKQTEHAADELHNLIKDLGPKAFNKGLRTKVNAFGTMFSKLLYGSAEPGQEPDDSTKSKIDALIETVENDPVKRPLENPAIFDNWQVSYVSTALAPKQEGQPAGGRFRGRIGRSIFKLNELCQSAVSPDIVTNKLGFTLLGLIRGSVGLRGTFEALGEDADTIKISFQSPVLSLGSNVHLRIGPTSSVVLTTTWLDEHIRLGKGSRGSRFIFLRGGYANSAGLDAIGQQSTTTSGYAALLFALSGLCAATFALALKPLILTRVAAVLVGLFAGAVGFVVYRGGQFSQPQQTSSD